MNPILRKPPPELPAPAPPFEGVFASFKEAKPTNAEFNKSWWASRCQKAISDAQDSMSTVFPFAQPSHWLLPFLVGTMPK